MTDRRSARINDGRASSGSGSKPPKGQRAHQMRKAARKLAEQYTAERDADQRRKRGRPTSYTAETGEAICLHIAEGGNLTQFCEPDDRPSRATVYNWLVREPDFLDCFSRARQARALGRVDEMDAIIGEVRAGQLEPHAARIILDHFRWLAAREAPMLFGDKVQAELVVPGASRRLEANELARRVAHYLEVARMKQEGLLIDVKPIAQIEKAFEGGSGDPGEG